MRLRKAKLISPKDRKQVWDGKPYIIYAGELQDDSCCDCGLVHRSEYTTNGEDIIINTARHAGSTALQRRAKDCALLDGSSKTYVMITTKELRRLRKAAAE